MVSTHGGTSGMSGPIGGSCAARMPGALNAPEVIVMFRF
jgi:hypothetical protein